METEHEEAASTQTHDDPKTATKVIVASNDRNKKAFQQTAFKVAGLVLFALVGTVLLAQTFAAPRNGKGGGKATQTNPVSTYAATARTTNLGFSLLTTHPYASKAGFNYNTVDYYNGNKLCLPPGSTVPSGQAGFIFVDTDGDGFCPVGQSLTDMAIAANGDLVAGYGDWNANVDSFGVDAGRIGIVPYNVTTKTWGNIVYGGTEALDSIRSFNGNLYTTTTDPSDKIASGQTRNNVDGYITNEGGSWHFVPTLLPGGATHSIDIGTTNGTDKLIVGSNDYPGTAIAWRSADGTTNWTQSLSQTNSTPTGFQRYSWIGSIGSSTYINAYDTTDKNLQVFNGTSWSKGSTMFCYYAFNPKMVVSFDNKILCSQFSPSPSPCYVSLTGAVCLFDGKQVSVYQYLAGATRTTADFYQANGYLYAMTAGGDILRTNSLSTKWQYLGKFDTANGSANTLAVYNDEIYVGSDSGKIFKSTVPISQIQ